MLKPLLEQLLADAVRRLVGTHVPEMPEAALIAVERTRDGARGDFASNVAMRLAKASGKSPRELAHAIVAALPQSAFVAKAEVAGEGFINFHVAPDALAREICRIHELGDAYGRLSIGGGKRVVLEFVFGTPIRPLNAGHGRLAAYGASLAKVLALAGHDVHREFRIDDDERDRIVVHAAGEEAVTLFRGATTVNAAEHLDHPHTLRQLRKLIGMDGCRFFFLMRSPEQNLDLDLKLARSRTNENPLYYVQYAHARIASAMKELRARGMSFDLAAGLSNLAALDKRTEQSLIAVLLRFPEYVEVAATNCAPHSIVYYLRDVANAFHTYYNAEKWIVEEAGLRNARLALVLAARQVLRNGLALLRVSAPESM